MGQENYSALGSNLGVPFQVYLSFLELLTHLIHSLQLDLTQITFHTLRTSLVLLSESNEDYVIET